jgi:hypothetical protein
MSERRDPLADDDLPRDERLLEALRHAPDRDVEPPAALSARILASARAATVQSAPAPVAGRRWRARLFDAVASVAPPRPPWAAAFGTLVAAVLVGVLWSTSRDDEPATTDAAPPPAKAARETPQPEARRPAGNMSAAPASPAVPPAAAPKPPVVMDSARERSAAPATSPAPAKAESQAAARSTVPSAAPTPAAPSAPAPAAAARSNTAAGGSLQRRIESADAASPPAAEARTAAAARSADPMVRLDAALAARPDEVSWRHALRTHFHEGPQRRWWAQLRDDTRGRWRAAPESRRESVQPWVTVSVAGQRAAMFWFEDDVLWLRDDAGLWRVAVTPAQQRLWQAGLVTW